ncbi:MAG: hypothetical protein ACI85U_003193, partial [Candidatus Promineifilaceae bacterium]
GTLILLGVRMIQRREYLGQAKAGKVKAIVVINAG